MSLMGDKKNELNADPQGVGSVSRRMSVLIGTPIHESKDYAMERWLESVSKFHYFFDLFLVDNSDNIGYVDKVHGYCKKYGVTNYKLVHIDVGPNVALDERLAQSRELIRKEVLDKNYDAWLSLECDVIAPPDALSRLVDLIGDCWMASHAYPGRENPQESNVEFGLTLIKRRALEKYGFMNQYGYIDPLRPGSWYGNEVWFIRRLDRDDEGQHIHVYGIIKPIYHLNRIV